MPPSLKPVFSPSRSVLRSADDLIAAGLASRDQRAGLDEVAQHYAVAVTPVLADLIDTDDPADPIARQFVPDPRELLTDPSERADPIGDEAHSPVPGIVHRYRDRVLLKIVGVCAVYCRFCFRREMVGPGAEQALSPAALDTALAYVAAHPEIFEVILTGGDPLMLAPRRMGEIVRRIAEIPHVGVVRFHTRVPIAAPERVDAALIGAMKAAGAASFLAVHVNHARELTPAARAALARLADAGIPLVSQSVLLRGVNDDVETLDALFRALLSCRVKPYYLHHPDLAPGTGHFRLPIARGQELMDALRGRLSGLALPTYVLDIPGGAGKVPLTSAYVEADGAGYVVRDPSGALHTYPPAD